MDFLLKGKNINKLWQTNCRLFYLLLKQENFSVRSDLLWQKYFADSSINKIISTLRAPNAHNLQRRLIHIWCYITKFIIRLFFSCFMLLYLIIFYKLLLISTWYVANSVISWLYFMFITIVLLIPFIIFIFIFLNLNFIIFFVLVCLLYWR